MEEIILKFCCPFDGKKLSKVEAYRCATINIRRKCSECGRNYSLTITPIAIASGWAHSALITELEQKTQNHWPGEKTL